MASEVHHIRLMPFSRSLLLLTLLAFPACASTDFQGVVIRIADGDTITVLHENVPERIRLWGIDSPEKKQDFGTRAKQFTGDLAFQKTVTVRVKDHDRYGRTVAEIMLPDGGNLNKEILNAGMAWVFRRYCHDQTYYHLESEAKEQRIGLWSQPHPTAPWDFRKTVLMQ